MMIKHFEIWIANLNPRLGTEAGKIRPGIVVQTDLLNKQHPWYSIICSITKSMQRESEIFRVHLKKQHLASQKIAT
jgi:mRNA interferase MazF